MKHARSTTHPTKTMRQKSGHRPVFCRIASIPGMAPAIGAAGFSLKISDTMQHAAIMTAAADGRASAATNIPDVEMAPDNAAADKGRGAHAVWCGYRFWRRYVQLRHKRHGLRRRRYKKYMGG
jgi:hypothetical protein